MFRLLQNADVKRWANMLDCGFFFFPSLLDNQPDQWSLALLLSACQLKVIGHVAFIMPPLGG